jgi:hypothetical protein
MEGGTAMAKAIRVVSISDRELSAVQEGREITGRYRLADLILLADTLGIDPYDLQVAGVVRCSESNK